MGVFLQDTQRCLSASYIETHIHIYYMEIVFQVFTIQVHFQIINKWSPTPSAYYMKKMLWTNAQTDEQNNKWSNIGNGLTASSNNYNFWLKTASSNQRDNK